MSSSQSPLNNGPRNALDPVFLFSVRGAVVVVTGGGTGIGIMIATALASNGATVYIIGRRYDVLEKAAAEYNDNHGKIIPLQGDVTSRESLLVLAETVKARHGYIDLLINNAGIARNLFSHPLPSPCASSSLTDKSQAPTSIKAFQSALWDAGSPEDFADTFATNVTAVYYTTVAFLELLHQGNVRQQLQERVGTDISSPDSSLPSPSSQWPPYHASQVLTISSSGAFRLDSKVLSPSYTVAKCASTHLGKLLANLLAPWGVRSNVLAPGVWPSEMTSSHPSTAPDTLARTVPLQRAGTQEDMAGAVLFLASRAGAYVNGAVWLVDGGRVGGVASNYYQ